MYIEQVIQAINEADALSADLASPPGVLTGFSGTKLIGALARFARTFEADPNAAYLEVGVFQGLTLLSVASAVPGLACYGIDNFAFFDAEGKNLGIVNERRAKLGADNAQIINADYEDALESLGSHLGDRKVAVYFVDGPHDYRSQLMCLELALPHLHEDCVIVIDDSNYPHVRQANRDFLVTHPDFRLLFEAYTPCHPGNMTPADEASAREGWWNGVNIVVRDSGGRLPEMLPPTRRSRELYEQEHIVHSASTAELSDLAHQLLQALDGRSPRTAARAFARVLRGLRRTRQDRAGRFATMNTYSAGLPERRMNAVVEGE